MRLINTLLIVPLAVVLSAVLGRISQAIAPGGAEVRQAADD
ncbi:MAG TPA: hypothetical protein VEG38_06130 [Acidimicrobiia bacterium]|nr:hypothetical protein [Acidimicrobiia bacterium]